MRSGGALAALWVTIPALSVRADPVRSARADPPPAPEAARSEPEQPAEPASADQGWFHGDHLTGDWGGARSALADHGVTIDVFYASDLFTARGETAALGHVDAALTLDSHKLGGW